MVARLDRDRVANGNCAVVSRHPDQRPLRGLRPAGRWPGGPTRNGGHVSSVLTAVGVLPAGGRTSAERRQAVWIAAAVPAPPFFSRSWLFGPVRPYARVEGKRTITVIAPDPGSCIRTVLRMWR